MLSQKSYLSQILLDLNGHKRTLKGPDRIQKDYTSPQEIALPALQRLEDSTLMINRRVSVSRINMNK